MGTRRLNRAIALWGRNGPATCSLEFATLVNENRFQTRPRDQSLRRLFTARFKQGLFDPPATVPWSTYGAAQNDTAAHRQLTLKTTRESNVLLKNQNGLLPLKGTYKNIAVIGPGANSVDAL